MNSKRDMTNRMKEKYISKIYTEIFGVRIILNMYTVHKEK